MYIIYTIIQYGFKLCYNRIQQFQQSRNDGGNVDVKAIMDTWTLQMNYPVVKVTRTGNSLQFQQSRFLKNSNAEDPGKYHSQFK